MLAYQGTTWLTLNGLEAMPADVIHAVRMGAGRWFSQIRKICKLDGVSFPTIEVWEWELKSILDVFTVVMLEMFYLTLGVVGGTGIKLVH